LSRKRARGNGDADVWPRKNEEGKLIGYRGSYWVHTVSGKKRRYVSGKTKGETRAALNKAKADTAGGLVFDTQRLRLGDYLDRWLEDVRDTVRLRTFERYEQIVRKHIVPKLGDNKLKALTPHHIRGLYKEKLQSLSPRTVQYIHVTMHKALKQAVNDGLIPRNTTEAVKLSQLRREEICPLSLDQVKVLFEAARGDRLECLYTVAVTCGLRQGELLGLKWEDVDLEANTLQVRRSLSNGTSTSPKTAKSRRSITLPQRPVIALRNHRERQLGEATPGLVFTSETGGPLDRYHVRRRFKALLKHAGLPEIRFHDLRHTCATVLLSMNVNPKIVSEMLGHATIAITLDTYSHVLPNMGDAAAGAMDDALS
jgi:integrase